MNLTDIQDQYVRDVALLVDDIFSENNGSSLFHDITEYFIQEAKNNRAQLDLKIQISDAQDAIASGEDSNNLIQVKLNELIEALENTKQQNNDDKHDRLGRVRDVCHRLYAFCEGKTVAESERKSAKFMSALWFLSELHSDEFQHYHQRVKLPYKLVVTLRFLDKIIEQKQLSVPNWKDFTNPLMRFESEESADRWFDMVALPVMMASLFQDAGLQHPLSIRLLYGNDQQADPFRVLDNEERSQLLKMNYRFTIDYITLGLGIGSATDTTNAEEQVIAHATTLQLIKDAYKPASGIGEILKIPQIHASVVFSTKSDYSRSEVPKGCMLVDQLGKKEVINQDLADTFNAIFGVFPQGYGVLNSSHKGIVFGLFPHQPHQPYMLPLLSVDEDISEEPAFELKKEDNFYFNATRASYFKKKHDNPQVNEYYWYASHEINKWMSRWTSI